MTVLPSLGVKGGQKTEVLGLLLLLQGSPGTTDEKQSEAGPWGSNFEALLFFTLLLVREELCDLGQQPGPRCWCCVSTPAMGQEAAPPMTRPF